ncbi:MAG: hypothetical protein BWK80_49085 [Desulfobacteraceae bacterium IS3]|nr:MAG: hypothetical protein BWK80_49085 [Desulfobacteraceae bacterium IS3]
MDVRCEKCKTAFNIADSLIRPEGSKVCCSKCRHTFRIYPSEDSEDFPRFKIAEEYQCPLYKSGDEFQLSGKKFLPPPDKPPCLILVKDVMKLILHKKEHRNEKTLFKCSGCTGHIRFGYKNILVKRYENYKDALLNLLRRFSIFERMSEENIREIILHLKLERFEKGDFVLRKGDFGNNLYIIISGRIDVLNDDYIRIASIGKGEIFGEMSLITGGRVGTTLKASEQTAALRISSDHFRKFLSKFQTLHMNLIRLMVQRMAEINRARIEEFSSGITGRLTEMPPPDLFQTLSIGQKTGVLTLKLPRETYASLSFREGRLIKATYNNTKGEEAFFELLKQKEGRFNYVPGLSHEEMNAPEMGEFMGLLIEGLRRIDEENRRFLRTVIPTLM